MKKGDVRIPEEALKRLLGAKSEGEVRQIIDEFVADLDLLLCVLCLLVQKHGLGFGGPMWSYETFDKVTETGTYSKEKKE